MTRINGVEIMQASPEAGRSAAAPQGHIESSSETPTGVEPDNYYYPENIARLPVFQKESLKTSSHEIEGKSIPKFLRPEENQDQIAVTKNGVGVFDGVSGSNDGRMASYLGAETVREMLSGDLGVFKDIEDAEKFARQVLYAVKEKVENAGKLQIQKGVDRKKVMMTAGCIALLWGGHITVVSAADVRFLKISKEGELEHITVDNQHENFHTDYYSVERNDYLDAQKELSSIKTRAEYDSLDYFTWSVLRRNKYLRNAIGRDDGDEFKPSIATIKDESNDGAKYLILSDGVTANLTDTQIVEVLMKNDMNNEEKVHKLISLAEEVSRAGRCEDNQRPNPDDISAVLIAGSKKN